MFLDLLGRLAAITAGMSEEKSIELLNFLLHSHDLLLEVGVVDRFVVGVSLQLLRLLLLVDSALGSC